MKAKRNYTAKPPFYYRIWFFVLLFLGGFFGILATDYALFLWLIGMILIVLRIRWSIKAFLKRRREQDLDADIELPSDRSEQVTPVPLRTDSESVVKATVQPIVTPPVTATIPAIPDAEPALSEEKSAQPENHISLSGWYISVSFGKSSSQNYLKAVTLAKAAPQYHEQEDDGHILHQAFYSASPSDYLAFVMLYELVGGWKSSFVMVNGKLVDRKIIGQLNYCYGDRCRSQNKRFCYGASYMTENPFGCHRIQVSACNHPWWSFYRQEGRNRYVLDKSAILDRIDSAKAVYGICPCFDYDAIVNELNRLPPHLSERQFKKLAENGFGLRM